MGCVVPVGAPTLQRRLQRAAPVAVFAPMLVWAYLTPGALPGAWWWGCLGALMWWGWSLWAARAPAWTALRLPAPAAVASSPPVVRAAGHRMLVQPCAWAIGPAWPRGLPLASLHVVWDAEDALLLRAVGQDGRVLWGWLAREALPPDAPLTWEQVRRALVTGGAFRSAIFDHPAHMP
ncbi:hypothetical protein [Tepidimonas charontis]|nr:hypothetical protein [Tepidimonas charontis]